MKWFGDEIQYLLIRWAHFRKLITILRYRPHLLWNISFEIKMNEQLPSNLLISIPRVIIVEFQEFPSFAEPAIISGFRMYTWMDCMLNSVDRMRECWRPTRCKHYRRVIFIWDILWVKRLHRCYEPTFIHIRAPVVRDMQTEESMVLK